MSNDKEVTNDSITFDQFLEEFRTDFGGWSPNTWRGLSGMLTKLSAEFGDQPLGGITTRQIERYLTRRQRQDGLAPGTTNRYLAVLKTLFLTARKWDYLQRVPTDEIKLQKEQSRVPDALSEDELDALIAECPEHTRQLVILAADTGLRRSEIGRLTWDDVDFEMGTLTVRESKNKDYRVIPLTDQVRDLLQYLR